MAKTYDGQTIWLTQTFFIILFRRLQSFDDFKKTNPRDTKSIAMKMLGFTNLFILILHLQAWYAPAFSFNVAGSIKPQRTSMETSVQSTTNIGNQELVDDNVALSSRRSIINQFVTATAGTIATITLSPLDICYAASPKQVIDPDTAYLNLRKAREELVVAGRNYFPKRDWDGLREYLSNEDMNINNYDANAGALLTSKRLDTESKQAIGTIRRYGVGADVIIMYGGLKAELSEDNEQPNTAEIEKYYIKTLDSLEEVIAIVRSNPGFKNIE